ncbi:MAG TPA: prepilin-type N-terminal cleavage/methylation domain-containing protein [Phycisphaerales bacterium]|nr:prepilin-type N-terminal cleavage/methylation domain-containing protein [Phycisphaerales bacterium]
MRRAFTMLELLIVLIVIGLLVAIAAPRFSRARESSRMAATIATYNAIARAAEFYLADNSAYPPDYVQKSSHALFKPYINTSIFQSSAPIGGDWDWNNRTNVAGNVVGHWTLIGPNISINETVPPLVKWTQFDAWADDVRLTTGTLRRERTTFLVMRVPDVVR